MPLTVKSNGISRTVWDKSDYKVYDLTVPDGFLASGGVCKLFVYGAFATISVYGTAANAITQWQSFAIDHPSGCIPSTVFEHATGDWNVKPTPSGLTFQARQAIPSGNTVRITTTYPISA